ncbi:MAG TPA: glycosyltransferase [Chloroflexota bacterium]|nr:glycosyltransferase [Chloroflexota bacterium]
MAVGAAGQFLPAGTRLAVAHEYLNQYGGAERVLERMHDLFPDAPIYTSMYGPGIMPAGYRAWDIRTSFMQRLPMVTTRHQMYLMAYPLAFESFDFSNYDVVLSNSSAFAKGVVTGPETLHVCYCLTPMRWVWRYREYVHGENLGFLARFVLPPFIQYLRLWDVTSAKRVDRFIAISRAVAARIEKYYGRQAEIIYPPVDTDHFSASGEPDDYYLTVARLIPYRRIDLVVDAFSRLGLRVKIVGDGRDHTRLRARASTNVEFVGRVDDETLTQLYAGCRAYLIVAEEDFGIAPVEAQAAGRPVVAYAAGGALDTVIDGETGVLFREQSPEALAEAVRKLEQSSFDSSRIRANAERFSSNVFRERLSTFLARAYQEWRERGGLREPALAG